MAQWPQPFLQITQCLMCIRRFSTSCKLVRPANPEMDTTDGVPNAEAFWKWLDKAVATTQRMIREDGDRQVAWMHAVVSDVCNIYACEVLPCNGMYMIVIADWLNHVESLHAYMLKCCMLAQLVGGNGSSNAQLHRASTCHWASIWHPSSPAAYLEDCAAPILCPRVWMR